MHVSKYLMWRFFCVYEVYGVGTKHGLMDFQKQRCSLPENAHYLKPAYLKTTMHIIWFSLPENASCYLSEYAWAVTMRNQLASPSVPFLQPDRNLLHHAVSLKIQIAHLCYYSFTDPDAHCWLLAPWDKTESAGFDALYDLCPNISASIAGK